MVIGPVLCIGAAIVAFGAVDEFLYDGAVPDKATLGADDERDFESAIQLSVRRNSAHRSGAHSFRNRKSQKDRIRRLEAWWCACHNQIVSWQKYHQLPGR